MPMRGLTMLVVAADAERLHAALTFAAAGAAMGTTIRLHLHEGAVGLLRAPLTASGDAARLKAGLPGLSEILEEALSLGVSVTACQSGLALAGLDLSQLDSRIDAQGPVGLLTTLGDDRLLIF